MKQGPLALHESEPEAEEEKATAERLETSPFLWIVVIRRAQAQRLSFPGSRQPRLMPFLPMDPPRQARLLQWAACSDLEPLLLPPAPRGPLTPRPAWG